MKTEQQIRQWAKSHTVHENDVHAIMGYLTAIEAEIENDITFNIGAKKECFDRFVEWFEKPDVNSFTEKGNSLYDGFLNRVEWQIKTKYEYLKGITDMQKTVIQESRKLNPTPSYKFGDWVRSKKNSELHQIVITGIHSAITTKYAYIPYDDIEPATPKEGEFWYAEYKTNGRFSKSIFQQYGYGLENENIVFDKAILYISKEVLLYLPATESEKNQLIKAVEDKYNKTFNGKEWVDMYKKGDYVVQNKAVRIYLDICSHINSMGEIGKDSNIVERYASPLESRCFDISLKSIGKRFNPETKELEDILKVGDLVIYWDADNKTKARVGILERIDYDKSFKYGINGIIANWEHAIKFTSEQQYRDFLKEK